MKNYLPQKKALATATFPKVAQVSRPTASLPKIKRESNTTHALGALSKVVDYFTGTSRYDSKENPESAPEKMRRATERKQEDANGARKGPFKPQ
jgi:hypothetical protein